MKWFVKEQRIVSQITARSYNYDIFWRQNHCAVWTQHNTPQHSTKKPMAIDGKWSHWGQNMTSCWLHERDVGQNRLVQSDMLGTSWQKIDRVTFINIPKTFWKNMCLVWQIPPLEVRTGYRSTTFEHNFCLHLTKKKHWNVSQTQQTCLKIGNILS